jgi:hypothetical protein
LRYREKIRRGESTRKQEKKKDKELPVQAWKGPDCSRRLRLPVFKKFGT